MTGTTVGLNRKYREVPLLKLSDDVLRSWPLIVRGGVAWCQRRACRKIGVDVGVGTGSASSGLWLQSPCGSSDREAGIAAAVSQVGVG